MSKVNLEKTLELSNLFYSYKNLLTSKQVENFELYFEEDLSFQEIADELNVSKAAVHDSITKTINTLYDLEEKMKLSMTKNSLLELVKENEHNENKDVVKIVEKIKEII